MGFEDEVEQSMYGRAKIHKSGAVYEEIWNRLIEAEKKGDPEKRGYAIMGGTG